MLQVIVLKVYSFNGSLNNMSDESTSFEKMMYVLGSKYSSIRSSY